MRHLWPRVKLYIVPCSRQCKLCHCPFSIFNTGPPGTISLVKHKFQRNLYVDEWTSSSGFQRIEHPLRLVLRGIAEVEVHPQPRPLKSENLPYYFRQSLHSFTFFRSEMTKSAVNIPTAIKKAPTNCILSPVPRQPYEKRSKPNTMAMTAQNNPFFSRFIVAVYYDYLKSKVST